jgi:hypothetical protein
MTVHDGVMTGGKRVLVWVGLGVAGIALVGMGVFFGVTRLDDADKWGSVVGALAALLGFPMTVYGIVLARRGATAAEPGQRSSADRGGAAGAVHQHVRAGRDAYTAGHDQYFGGGPGSR